jgi:hypothetical protein
MVCQVFGFYGFHLFLIEIEILLFFGIFSPQTTGRITAYLPSGGPFVRMDSHIYPDYVVPPSYDSLLGKVCQSVLFVTCHPPLSCYTT